MLFRPLLLHRWRNRLKPPQGTIVILTDQGELIRLAYNEYTTTGV
jgi:hypothetical protein